MSTPGDKRFYSQEPRPQVKRVRITNYKSIAQCDVTLTPFTLLVGPNGVGKSNFLDGLSFVADAIATTPQQAIENRNGLAEILHRSPDPADSFSITIDFTGGGFGTAKELWSYGFEIRSSQGETDLQFEVLHEQCRISRGASTNNYSVTLGTVEGPDVPPGTTIEPGRLFLPAASSVISSLRRVSKTLRGMRFYNFEANALRLPRPILKRAVLGRRGSHLGDALGQLREMRPEARDRIDDYLAAVAPGVIGIERQEVGRYVTVEMRQRTAGGADITFGPDSMSDGTIRAAGVLAAIFQAPTWDGHITLVGIEEPETALHPAATSALYDALTEASEHVQVIATTQSDDLLDRDDVDLDAILAVSNKNGSTIIGPLDTASQQIVRDGHFTVGALMRANQLFPEPVDVEGFGQAAE